MAATTFSGLWSDLKATAAKAWQSLQADAVAAEHAIAPVIEQDIVAVLDQFKTLAVQTVFDLAKGEFSAMSGSEKQSTVVTKVFQAAEAAGHNIAIQDVQMFAQQAYNAVASEAHTLGKH